MTEQDVFKLGLRYGLDIAIKRLRDRAVKHFLVFDNDLAVIFRDIAVGLEEERVVQSKTDYRVLPYVAP